MCVLRRKGLCIEVNDSRSIRESIQLLLAEPATCFSVEKRGRERLSVVFGDRGCCVVYIRDEPTYCALDASTAPTNCRGKVSILVDGEVTPIPANIKLTKRQTIAIIREFCESGKLSELVDWIREEPA